jgi:nicotinamidase-related amidase
MGRTVRYWRSTGRPIIHLIRLYETSGENVDSCRRSLIESGVQVVAPGTTGSQLVDELETPTPFNSPQLLSVPWEELSSSEFVLYKSRWGGFYRTHLDELLKALGCDSIIIVGVNWPNCPRTTLYEASERDYRIGTIRGCVSHFDSNAANELEGIGGVCFESLESLMSAAKESR